MNTPDSIKEQTEMINELSKFTDALNVLLKNLIELNQLVSMPFNFSSPCLDESMETEKEKYNPTYKPVTDTNGRKLWKYKKPPPPKSSKKPENGSGIMYVAKNKGTINYFNGKKSE